jgi:hypothetical protein
MPKKSEKITNVMQRPPKSNFNKMSSVLYDMPVHEKGYL